MKSLTFGLFEVASAFIFKSNQVIMTTKQRKMEGSLDTIPENHIYLNIDHLEDGLYVLKILKNKRIIKRILFKK